MQAMYFPQIHMHLREGAKKGRKRIKLCMYSMEAAQNLTKKNQNMWTHPCTNHTIQKYKKLWPFNKTKTNLATPNVYSPSKLKVS